MAFFGNQLCIVRPTFIDLNPTKFNYHPFMISLDKCNGSCNAVDNLSTKIYKSTWNNETCECKNYHTCKKDYSWDPSTCICENGKYLKSIADGSKIVFDEITNATDNVSKNVSKNFHNKKVRYKMDCYIPHIVLLLIILLIIIVIICFHYANHRSKLRKKHFVILNYKNGQ